MAACNVMLVPRTLIPDSPPAWILRPSLVVKSEVAELLEKKLRKPGYEPRTLALGLNADPYQPMVRTPQLTRSVLEVLDRFNHPVGIVTKSSGILRDLDILSSVAKRNLVRAPVSITTLDPHLARVLEPRAATPDPRLRIIAELTRACVLSGVLAAPIIAALNDAELENILEALAKADARYASFVLLRLPLELRQMFEEGLHAHYLDRARHVFSLDRQTRAGELNDLPFRHRFSGQDVCGFADAAVCEGHAAVRVQ